jgi:hypothetical protein
MRILFINVLLILVKYAFSAIDVGKYFELDNILPKEGYLFSLDDCSKTYICTKRDEGFWGISDDWLLL